MNSAEKEAIATLNEHLDHWKRLLSEKICDQSEGEKTIDALQNAIKALEQDPCGDCISRDAVLKAIDAKAWEFCDYLISKGRNDEQKPVSHFADNLRECVGEDLPSVTPQPKMGHWISYNWNDNGIARWGIKCDQCYKEYRYGGEMGGTYKYCPDCGSKMSEVEDV